MSARFGCVSCTLLLAAVAAACGSNPTGPSTSTATTASGVASSSGSVTGSVTSPRPLQPVDGAQIRHVDQPVMLVAQNAVVTKAGGTTYTFEIATDAAFSSKVQTKDGVAEGSSGQTSVKLDTLAAARDYYWHARAHGAGTTGVFGPTYKFTIGPAIVINAPTPVGPLNRASTSGWPTFTVNDAVRSGPVGSLVYRFEIGTNAAFSTIILTGTVSETPNQTSFTPPASQALPPTQTTLYWRATAIDQTNAISSPASTVQSFTPSNTPQSALAALLGGSLWPGIQPPGSTGHAVLGNNWQVQTLRAFTGVTFVSPTLEELQVFDLLDRGFDPQGAIDWMSRNGYPTTAAYYPSVNVIGFPTEYMALINGRWDLILKVGA